MPSGFTVPSSMAFMRSYAQQAKVSRSTMLDSVKHGRECDEGVKTVRISQRIEREKVNIWQSKFKE